MTTATVLEALKVFCDQDSYRYSLSNPWAADGRTYATDGRVAAWVDGELDAPQPDGRVPKMNNIIDVDSPTDLPFDADMSCEKCGDTGLVELKSCDECDGSGKCLECGGSGTEECLSCGHEHDCDECGGTGDCDECGGEGSGELRSVDCKCCKERQVDILGRKLDIKTARKIASLASVRCGISKRDKDLLVFTADSGIRGVASLMREPWA